MGVARGLRALGTGVQLPRRATYRSEPLRRRSLVRAARLGLAVVDLSLVMRICSVLGGMTESFLVWGLLVLATGERWGLN